MSEIRKRKNNNNNNNNSNNNNNNNGNSGNNKNKKKRVNENNKNKKNGEEKIEKIEKNKNNNKEEVIEEENKEEEDRIKLENKKKQIQKKIKQQHCTYYISSYIFLRLIGVLFMVAFISTWTQIHGLVGENGISPISSYFERLRNGIYSSSHTGFFQYPSIFWFNQNDITIHAVCALGTLSGFLLFLDMIPVISSFLCWALYLSITVGGQSFFSFQWDHLLLETGFLTIFYTPLHFSLKPFNENPREFAIPGAISWLYRLLIFRIHFGKGIQALLGKDKAWRSLVAFSYFFETQPSPTRFSWHLHKLPDWAHQGLVFWVLTIEVGIVFLIIGPKLFRRTAALYLILLQFFYISVSNYGTWHYNVLLLCFLLIDDDFFPKINFFFRRLRLQKQRLLYLNSTKPNNNQPNKYYHKLKRLLKSKQSTIWKRRISILIAVFIILLTTIPLSLVSSNNNITAPDALVDIYRNSYSFKLVNMYGPFEKVEKDRYDLVIEGSLDAQNWHPYHYLYKAGENNLWTAPFFVSPHISRIERALWLAAQSDYNNHIWISRLLHRLLEDSPDVISLFKKNPFENKSPEYIRAVRYLYKFTDDVTSKQLEGAWWYSEHFDIFTPSFSQTVHSMSTRRKNLRTRIAKGV